MAVASQGENRDNNNKKSNNYGSSKEKAAPTTQAHPQVPVPSVPSWPEQGTALKEPMQYAAAAPPSYAPGLMQPHGIFPNQDWNGYQVVVAFVLDFQVHVQYQTSISVPRCAYEL